MVKEGTQREEPARKDTSPPPIIGTQATTQEPDVIKQKVTEPSTRKLGITAPLEITTPLEILMARPLEGRLKPTGTMNST